MIAQLENEKLELQTTIYTLRYQLSQGGGSEVSNVDGDFDVTASLKAQTTSLLESLQVLLIILKYYLFGCKILFYTNRLVKRKIEN